MIWAIPKTGTNSNRLWKESLVLSLQKKKKKKRKKEKRRRSKVTILHDVKAKPHVIRHSTTLS